MEKYEYITVIWDFAPLGKMIRVISADGNEKKFKIDGGLGISNQGDIEFLQITNHLGSEGWQMFNVSTIAYGRGNFMTRGYLRRKIS